MATAKMADMDIAGYVGFTATVMEHKGEYVVFCWSPYPGPIKLEDAEEMMDQMIKDMTDSKDDWRMWYECNKDFKQVH